MMRPVHISTVIGSTVDETLQIPLIKKAGFDGFFTTYSDLGTEELWAETAQKNRLAFETLHGPFEFANRMWEEGDVGEEYLTYLKHTIDVCSQIHVTKYILHVTVGNTAPPVSQMGLDRFRGLCGYAKERRVHICFENLEPMPHLDAVMEEITDPYHGFCWDIGHNSCYTPQTDFLKHYAGRLKCLHIHDNKGVTRPGSPDYQDDLHLLPFDGILDWDWFAARLRECRYDGPITLEVSCLGSPAYQNMSIEEYLAAAYGRGCILRDKVDGIL